MSVYLLDTCVFYWICSKPAKLPPPIARLLRNEPDQLHVSHVSALEIVNLWLAGKMQDPTKPRQWFREQIANWNVSIIRIDEEDIFRASELPVHHRDPFDRLLIAQAIIRHMTLITPDTIIHRYPVSTLW